MAPRFAHLLLPVLVVVNGASCRSPREPAARPAGSLVQPAGPTERHLAFAIVSPRVGDTLLEGRSYTIRWLAPDTFRINLGAAMGGKDKGYLLTDAPASPDSLVWTVPAGFVTGFGIVSSDVVRLRLENAANPDQWTETGPFTIRGTAP